MEPGSKLRLERRKICFSSLLLPLRSYLHLVPTGSGWDASLRHEVPHLWGTQRGTRHLLKWGSLLKSFLYFHIPGDICLYSFTFYLVFFSTRFLFTHLEFANYFFFFHNNWMPYLLILAATLLQLRSLRLWKALKNKSELSSYKTDVFLSSAQREGYIVQTCNGLGAPKTAAPPRPDLTSRMFSFSSDLDL